MVNCVVAGSLSGNGSPVADYLEMGYDSVLKFGHAAGTATSSGSHNVIQNLAGSFGGTYTTGDPSLEDLANNGGPTPTLASASGGPAYNTGLDAQAPALNQRGVARP